MNTSQDCDLHAQDPGFLTKLGCVSSGGYREKITDQERQVRQSQRDNQNEKQRLADLRIREQESSQKLADEQARLAEVRSDLNQTLKRLQTQKRQSKASQAEIAKLQELQQQSQYASGSDEIEAIEKKIAEAKKRIDTLEQANMLH
ncbi:hypothetical protein PT300_01315 [Enterobacteriaceae bacterium ESL0689]|nr:hypothetical protein [Enterobacteriaceae bacterium ESL0689]